MSSEEFEKERKGIYFFPFFQRKLKKGQLWRNTFKMLSLFFFLSPTFPRGGDENREMERKNDERSAREYSLYCVQNWGGFEISLFLIITRFNASDATKEFTLSLHQRTGY